MSMFFEGGRRQYPSERQMRVLWVKAGPLMLEFHRRFQIGIAVNKWYAGAFLGPFCVSLGKRQWIEPSKISTVEMKITSTVAGEITASDWEEA